MQLNASNSFTEVMGPLLFDIDIFLFISIFPVFVNQNIQRVSVKHLKWPPTLVPKLAETRWHDHHSHHTHTRLLPRENMFIQSHPSACKVDNIPLLITTQFYISVIILKAISNAPISIIQHLSGFIIVSS